MNSFSKEQILMIGAIGAAVIFFWSFAKWRTAVKVAILAAIFEGALRKWALPQAQEMIYFLKDIFLAGAYARFFFFPDPATRAVTVKGPTALLIASAAIVSFSALNPSIGSIPAAILGLKIYLYYLPLVFMVPHLFRNHEDMVKNLSWFVLISIPVCCLGVLQFFSPTFSVLNQYAHQAAENTGYYTRMQGAGIATAGLEERVRITGTFSYISGLVTYVTFLTGLALVVVMSPEGKYKRIIQFIALPLLAANGFMSGSRAAVVAQGIVIVAFLMSASLLRLQGKAKALLNLVVTLGILFAAVTYIFREASEAYEERTGGEEAKQEFRERLWRPFEMIKIGMEAGGLEGYGIGMSHPATDALRKFLQEPPARVRVPIYESEPAQIALELGAIGFIVWYFMRIALVFITWRNLHLIQQPFFKMLTVLSLAVQLVHLHVQLVYNHTANFFLWALIGLTLIPFAQRRGRLSQQPAPSRAPTGRRYQAAGR